MPRNVTTVTWSWEKTVPGTSRHGATPPAPQILLPTLLGYGVAGLFYLTLPRVEPAITVAGINTVVLLLAFAAPRAHQCLQALLLRLGHLLGRVLGWLLLTPFYYVVMTLGHALLALRGKDPMQRAFLPRQPSYWQERPPRNQRHFSRLY